MRPAEQID